MAEGSSAFMSLGWTVLRKQGKLEDCVDLQREGLESLKRSSPAWEFLEEPKVGTLGGRQILKSVAANDEVALVQHVIVRERIAYRLTGMCPRAKLDHYRKVFERTAGSLSFRIPPQEAEDLATDRELTQLGLESQNRKDYQLAIDMYEAALSKDSLSDLKAEIHFSLSSACLEEASTLTSRERDPSIYKKAIESAENCLKLKPAHWLAMGNIAIAYTNLGDLEKAEEYYRLAEKNGDQAHPSYRQLTREHGECTALLKAKKGKEK